MIDEKDVLNALRNIIDPDFQKDIVSLGFVKNVRITESQVDVEIQLTTPACPVKTEFQRQAEGLIRQLPGIKTVHVQMTSAKAARPARSELPDGLRSVHSIVAISSCKGGVGKSTLAAVIALELASRGFKVGLLDADIHGPSVPSLFPLKGVAVYTNELQQILPVEFQGLKIMSFGFLLGEAPAVMRGPMVSQYIQQLLTQTAWGELDYLFIDLPPGTGDVQLTITQLVPLSGAVIITTRQTLSLVDVARGILMFEKVAVPILGVIENMASFICDQCQKKHYIFGGSQEKSLEDRFGLPILAEIPLLAELTGKIQKPVRHESVLKAVDNVVRSIGKLSATKTQIPEINFDAKNIYLRWEGGKRLRVPHRDLRFNCRCAVCINEFSGERVIKEEEISEDIQPKEVFPLGNYAIGIAWNDGHSSGIYPYKMIRKIGKEG